MRVQQWEGDRWNLVSDWVEADRAALRPLIDAKSEAYAREHGITPRDVGTN